MGSDHKTINGACSRNRQMGVMNTGYTAATEKQDDDGGETRSRGSRTGQKNDEGERIRH